MSPERVMPRALPRSWQSHVKRLKAELKARGLLDVLDSFPQPATFQFNNAIIYDQSTVRLLLGYRNQVDGAKVTVWTYMLSDHVEMVPPVVCREELPNSDRQAQMFPRAATSLLRKAIDLQPPFCFLQFDPLDNVTNVRDMLCALVLYYYLSAGLDECAIHWDKFDISLIKALEYIDDRPKYHQWIQEQLDDSAVTLEASVDEGTHHDVHTKEGIDTESMASSESDTSKERNGGMVRSAGQSIKARPGTTLAKLARALGDRIQLLEAIPPTPVPFSRQTIYPSYFPFRLQLGTYRTFEVYVYLTHDKRSTIRILGHDTDGNEHSWPFDKLQDVNLLEPYAYFVRMSDMDRRIRGDRIRYLVYYYFMLAENEGLIDNPRIQISPFMMKHLCSACRNLEEAEYSLLSNGNRMEAESNALAEASTRNFTGAERDIAGKAQHIGGTRKVRDPLRIDAETTEISLIVKLRLDPKLLANITGVILPCKGKETPNGEDEAGEPVPNAMEQLPQPLLPENLPVLSVEVQLKPQLDSYTVNTGEEPIISQHILNEKARVAVLGADKERREIVRDSAFVSATSSPVMPLNSDIDATLEDSIRSEGERTLNSGSDLISSNGQGSTITLGNTKVAQNLRHTDSSPVAEKISNHRRAQSVIILSGSSSSEEEPVYNHLGRRGRPHPLSSSTPHLMKSRPHPSDIIDLCSDDEDMVLPDLPKHRIEETPELRIIHRGEKHKIPANGTDGGAEEMSWYYGDEELMEDTDGDEWRRASWKRSQKKRVRRDE